MLLSFCNLFLDMLILFKYEYAQMFLVRDHMTFSVNLIFLLADIKRTIIIALPAGTFSVSYLLYDVLATQEKWQSYGNVSVLSEACYVMKTACWVLRLIFSGAEIIPAFFWTEHFLRNFDSNSAVRTRNFLPSLFFTLSCLLTFALYKKPNSLFWSILKLYATIAGLVLTVPSSHRMPDFRNILSAFILQILSLIDLVMSFKYLIINDD